MRPIPSHALSCTLAACTALAPTTGSGSGDPINGLAAVVNGKPITHAEVRTSVQAQRFLLRRNYPAGGPEYEAQLTEVETQALQELIDKELILADFEANGGSIKSLYVDQALEREIRERTEGDRAKFIEELRAENMTVGGLRKLLEKRIIVQSLRGQHSRDVPPPTPAEKDLYFKEHQDEFREDSFVKLRTITIYKDDGNGSTTPESQRKLADDIRQQLVSGADFGALARTHSVDSAASEGGDRGWVGKQDPKFNPGLLAIAFSMREGQFSEVLDVGSAYFILWVEDKQLGKLRPREEIDAEINQRVLQEKRRAAEEEWIARLRRNASIKLY